jgi:predicted RND superfamily exporter protein
MLKALAPILTALAGEEVKFAVSQTRRAAIFGVAIAIFGIITVTFLCVAAFLALAQAYGGPLAALILALLVLAVLNIQAAAEAKKRKQRIEADKSAMMATAALATIPSILKRPILAAALPLAGIALVSLLSDKKKRPPKA